MQIIKYGTRVKTVIGGIEALVTAACIRNENVSYEISYFQNGQNVCIWLQRIEIEVDYTIKKKAGLVNYDMEKETNLLIE